MHLVVIGANYASSSLEIREQLHRFMSLGAFSYPFVPLLTCNRSELYFATDNVAKAHQELTSLLRTSGITDFEESLYTLFDFDVSTHLASVASGLQSAIFGETEIQGQVRLTYEETRKKYPLPKELHVLFQNALRISKRIRNGYLDQKPLEKIETLLEEKITSLFGSSGNSKGLFIGASNINQKIAAHFIQKPHLSISLCNRTNEKAIELSQKLSLQYLPWDHLSTSLNDFDWIISGTKSSSYILHSDNIQEIISPLVIDLGVPRNIEPKLCTQTLVHLEQLTSSLRPIQAIKNDALEMIYSLTNPGKHYVNHPSSIP